MIPTHQPRGGPISSGRLVSESVCIVKQNEGKKESGGDAVTVSANRLGSDSCMVIKSHRHTMRQGAGTQARGRTLLQSIPCSSGSASGVLHKLGDVSANQET